MSLWLNIMFDNIILFENMIGYDTNMNYEHVVHAGTPRPSWMLWKWYKIIQIGFRNIRNLHT